MIYGDKDHEVQAEQGTLYLTSYHHSYGPPEGGGNLFPF